MLLVVFGNLGLAFFHLMKGERNEKMVKALTWRIGISIALFLLLMAGFMTGIIGNPNPHP